MDPRLAVSDGVGIELSSRLVSKQVLSPQQSLTSVFGMGTGGPSAVISLTTGAPSGIQPRDASRTHMIQSQLLATALHHTDTIWCTFRDSNPGPTD